MVCLIHAFCLLVLFNSALPWPILISMLLVLILSFMHILRCKVPVPAFSKLSYHTNYWLLYRSDGEMIRYEQVHIGFDAGLFILLILTNENSQKKLVVFNDQLTMFQRRALNIIGKLASSKKD